MVTIRGGSETWMAPYERVLAGWVAPRGTHCASKSPAGSTAHLAAKSRSVPRALHDEPGALRGAVHSHASPLPRSHHPALAGARRPARTHSREVLPVACTRDTCARPCSDAQRLLGEPHSAPLRLRSLQAPPAARLDQLSSSRFPTELGPQPGKARCSRRQVRQAARWLCCSCLRAPM